MQNKQKHQRDDMQREEEPECLGPKRKGVLGGGKRASERVNRRCDERLLETVRLGVVTPGMAASEERAGCAMMIRAAAGHGRDGSLGACSRPRSLRLSSAGNKGNQETLRFHSRNVTRKTKI